MRLVFILIGMVVMSVASCRPGARHSESRTELVNQWDIHLERVGHWQLISSSKASAPIVVELPATQMRSMRGHLDPTRIRLVCKDDGMDVSMIWSYGVVPQSEENKEPIFRMRFDEGEVQERVWRSPYHGQVEFLPKEPIAWMRQLLKADTLEVETEVKAFGRSTATFEARGLETVLAILPNTCSDPIEETK